MYIRTPGGCGSHGAVMYRPPAPGRLSDPKMGRTSGCTGKSLEHPRWCDNVFPSGRYEPHSHSSLYHAYWYNKVRITYSDEHWRENYDFIISRNRKTWVWKKGWEIRSRREPVLPRASAQRLPKPRATQKNDPAA